MWYYNHQNKENRIQVMHVCICVITWNTIEVYFIISHFHIFNFNASLKLIIHLITIKSDKLINDGSRHIGGHFYNIHIRYQREKLNKNNMQVDSLKPINHLVSKWH